MSPRPKSACGTPQAAARHRRNGEPLDDACRVAASDARKRRKGGTVGPRDNDAAVTVNAADGAVTFTVNSYANARILAAAVLDRHISLKQVSRSRSQPNATAQAEHAHRLYKQIVAQLREQGVMPS